MTDSSGWADHWAAESGEALGNLGAVQLALRPMTMEDLPMLARWVVAPHVAPWWRDDVPVAEQYPPCLDGRDPTETFIVSVDGRDVGFVQRCALEDEPLYQHALRAPSESVTLDYLIGEVAYVGRGIGPLLIARASANAFHRHPAAPSIVIGVEQSNVRSWRALEKAGYVRSWSGMVETGEPSDDQPEHVYVLHRNTGLGNV